MLPAETLTVNEQLTRICNISEIPHLEQNSQINKLAVRLEQRLIYFNLYLI